MRRPRAALLTPPRPAARASFAEDFGPRVLLTVDVEEEFDWNAPFRREGHTLDHVGELARFQALCDEIGAQPVYMIDWPIANDPRAVEIIGDAVRRGCAQVGMQLHAWVNPPFEEMLSAYNSFAGNLPAAIERAKFMALHERIVQAFGTAPIAYRAGRYGLGPDTPAILREAGIRIDSSVRSLFDYSREGGPDFSEFPAFPFWLDEARTLLELPVTTVYRGAMRAQGRHVHRLQRFIPSFFAAFSRFSLLERIALTPEGVTPAEAIRGVDRALEDGLPLLVLSFHSPSLAPGFTPYVRSAGDVEALYGWFREVYAYLERRSVKPAGLADILAAAR